MEQETEQNFEQLEPSEDFFKGFNHGYQISRDSPEMKETILSAENLPEDYLVGYEDGELQYSRDKEFSELTQDALDRSVDLDEGRER